MTHLFTTICTFKGGTYTHQVLAASPAEAFAEWAALFKGDAILRDDEQVLFEEEVAYSLSEDNMVAIANLKNVWYEGFSLGDDLLEVTLVAMSPAPVAGVSTKEAEGKEA